MRERPLAAVAKDRMIVAANSVRCGGGTRMVSSMVGWGTGDDWDKAIAFFAQGNEWTCRNLAACVRGGKPSFE
jgi:hypothetical protein